MSYQGREKELSDRRVAALEAFRAADEKQVKIWGKEKTQENFERWEATVKERNAALHTLVEVTKELSDFYVQVGKPRIAKLF